MRLADYLWNEPMPETGDNDPSALEYMYCLQRFIRHMGYETGMSDDVRTKYLEWHDRFLSEENKRG